MFNRDFFTFILVSVIVVNSRLMRAQSSASTGLEMIDIAIWVIVLLLGAVVYIVWHGLQIMRAQHQSTMAGLSSLGDTHKLGYEALTLTMQRLEQRVKQLEERR
jgi:flagellar basal body-associated protein FliL